MYLTLNDLWGSLLIQMICTKFLIAGLQASRLSQERSSSVCEIKNNTLEWSELPLPYEKTEHKEDYL